MVLVDLPADTQALELRARALKELGRYDAALADVNAARSGAPDDIDLLVLRGAIDAENIDTLVLRGDIREAARLAGN